MITGISIAGEATYPAEGAHLSDLGKINFIFGHNGCGKTTISRAVHAPDGRPGYSVRWKNERALRTLVYNRDFSEANFGDQMRGIFTLGKGETKAVEDIAKLQKEIAELDRKIGRLNAQLDGENGQGGRRAELSIALSALENACWETQKAHEYFEAGFTPHRKSKAAFCKQVLLEHKANTADLVDLDTLKASAQTVFVDAENAHRMVPIDLLRKFSAIEDHEILSRRIVGRDGAVVAGLITKLGNSDWVKHGMHYLRDAEGACPFCQQNVPDGLKAELDNFFDEQYEKDTGVISELEGRYRSLMTATENRYQSLLSAGGRFLDSQAVTVRFAELRAILEANYTALVQKKREPSCIVSIKSSKDVVAALETIVDAADTAVDAHNAMVADLANSKRRLISEIWRYVVEERHTDLNTYCATTDSVTKAIEGLEAALISKQALRREKIETLSRLEASVTSVLPTVAAINRILAMYGFQSFKLAVAGDRSEMYRIVRIDGSDAAKTLSEGERSFITFLYFYHLLAGSTSGSGTTEQKVVVFDDPVSSLDSDVLFIVCALIRNVVTETCEGKSSIQQVFVLTHNIYFHKEVSYDHKRPPNACHAHETFWIVRKRDNTSSVHRYEHNPVRTSYELLWDEVRNPDRPNLTIQNTLRRIVENYLVVLGGWDPKTIVALFSGRDAVMCRSFFSWIHAGSHNALDDLYVAVDDFTVEGYLRVFEQVFRETGQEAHYRMMMRVVDEIQPAGEEAGQPQPVPAQLQGSSTDLY